MLNCQHSLESKLHQLNQALGNGSASNLDRLLDQIVECQNKFNLSVQTKTEGAIIRSRTKWVELGEKHNVFLKLRTV